MGECIDIPALGSPDWKDPVSTFAALPSSGNNTGDARVTQDTQKIYVWSGLAWTLASGSGSNSFEIIQPPNGTSPTASSATDTLDLTSSDSSLTITGNSTTKAVDFKVGTLPGWSVSGLAPTLSVFNTSTDYSHIATLNISGNAPNNLQVKVSGQLVADFASSPRFGNAYAYFICAPGNNSEIRFQSDNYAYTNLVWQADGTASDIGTNDGGTTLARPRDLWLSRDVRLGNGVQIKEGTNQRMGVATLVSGTVTVSNTSVTANTRIFLTVQTAGGTQGFLSSTRTSGTSFTINSTSASDTSTVAWLLVEPN